MLLNSALLETLLHSVAPPPPPPPLPWHTGPVPLRPPPWPQAVHPSAASLLAEKEPPSSSSSSQGAPEDPATTGPQHIAGATESVVFGSFAKAAQQRVPSGGVKGVTRFLGFSGKWMANARVAALRNGRQAPGGRAGCLRSAQHARVVVHIDSCCIQAQPPPQVCCCFTAAPAAGVLPFWVFSPAVAQHLPLDMLLDPALISNPGLLQVPLLHCVALCCAVLCCCFSASDMHAIMRGGLLALMCSAVAMFPCGHGSRWSLAAAAALPPNYHFLLLISCMLHLCRRLGTAPLFCPSWEACTGAWP